MLAGCVYVLDPNTRANVYGAGTSASAPLDARGERRSGATAFDVTYGRDIS